MFLSIEGGDGAGKTTLIHYLKKVFEEKRRQVLITREPGGCPLAEQIRDWLLSADSSVSIGKRAEMLLFLAARAQNIEEVIKPALDVGTFVICDRFHDSTVAYQAYGRQEDPLFVRRLCHEACGLLVPELTLYLDVDVEVGKGRISGSKDRIEAEAQTFHERVRAGYWQIAQDDPSRFFIIDAHQGPEDVQEQALSIISSRF